MGKWVVPVLLLCIGLVSLVLSIKVAGKCFPEGCALMSHAELVEYTEYVARVTVKVMQEK